MTKEQAMKLNINDIIWVYDHGINLDDVKRTIKTCEEQKENSPEYYKQEIKEKHELLIRIKDELENNLAKAGKGEKP